MVRHQVRTGSAVHADAQQIVILDGSVERVDGLPAQHGAGAFDGHTGHHRNGYSKVAPQLFHRHQPRLEAAGIETGLDEQKVGASLDEAFGLQVVIGAKPGEGGGAGDIEILVGGSHGTGDEARLQQGEDVNALYKAHWQALEARRWREEVTTGRIKRARIDLLLSYWLSIHTGSEVPVERLFADFRIWLQHTTLTAAEILADLAHHGRAMQRMENLQPTIATGRLLQVLDLLTTTTPIPLMLHLHARDGVSEEQRSLAAAAIESYLIRRMACGLTTKDYNRLFLSILQTIRVAEDDTVGEQLVRQLADQSAPSRYWPEDGEFLTGLTQANIYRLLRGPRLRVLLGGMETALRKDKSELLFVPAQVVKLNIEHLIPQKWSQYYPLPTDRPIEEAEARRDLALHRLGNLTLTTTKLNSSISNGSWPTKRKELNKHAVLLVTAGSVLQAPPGVPSDMAIAWLDTWDEDRIELRTLYLAKIAIHAWPGPA